MDLLHRQRIACESAARLGGRKLMDWRERFQVQEKGVNDFVTDADFASQRAISEYLNHEFPEYDFLGE